MNDSTFLTAAEVADMTEIKTGRNGKTRVLKKAEFVVFAERSAIHHQERRGNGRFLHTKDRLKIPRPAPTLSDP